MNEGGKEGRKEWEREGRKERAGVKVARCKKGRNICVGRNIGTGRGVHDRSEKKYI